MDSPSPEAIKKQVEELTGFVDLVAEIWHGRNWVKRLVLLDTLLFVAFNPYFKASTSNSPTSIQSRRSNKPSSNSSRNDAGGRSAFKSAC